MKIDYSTGEGQKRLMAESIGMTYAPRKITSVVGDHGCDPIGGGMFRMVPSGDVVDYQERVRRLVR
jgi:hypothetical protein